MQKGFFMEIGKKIRELRMWKGLTQEELADLGRSERAVKGIYFPA